MNQDSKKGTQAMQTKMARTQLFPLCIHQTERSPEPLSHPDSLKARRASR